MHRHSITIAIPFAVLWALAGSARAAPNRCVVTAVSGPFQIYSVDPAVGDECLLDLAQLDTVTQLELGFATLPLPGPFELVHDSGGIRTYAAGFQDAWDPDVTLDVYDAEPSESVAVWIRWIESSKFVSNLALRCDPPADAAGDAAGGAKTDVADAIDPALEPSAAGCSAAGPSAQGAAFALALLAWLLRLRRARP